MPTLDSLERKFGHLAVPHLIPVIAALQLLNFFLVSANPQFIGFLVFVPSAIMEGEVWRLVTWILVPEGTQLIFILISTLFTMWIGRTLEEEWGTFKMTAYVIVTLLAVAVAGLLMGYLVPPLFIIPLPMLSLFFAGGLLASFAFLFPEKEILLMFVIPIKVKWLGFVAGGWAVYTIVTGPVLAPHILATWAGFLLFVAPEAVRNFKQGRSAAARRKKFEAAGSSSDTAFHTCSECGTTDTAAPDTEFRMAADGEEYCVPCLEQRSAG